jgi:hypothetical protein
LAAYAAHAREVCQQQGEIGHGAGTGISSGTELGGSGDNDIESPDYSSMRVEELKLGLRSRHLCSGGMKPLQRLPYDDAKPSDAQGDSSDSSKGRGNGSDS